jgi:hypothetical protein
MSGGGAGGSWWGGVSSALTHAASSAARVGPKGNLGDYKITFSVSPSISVLDIIVDQLNALFVGKLLMAERKSNSIVISTAPGVPGGGSTTINIQREGATAETTQYVLIIPGNLVSFIDAAGRAAGTDLLSTKLISVGPQINLLTCDLVGTHTMVGGYRRHRSSRKSGRKSRKSKRRSSKKRSSRRSGRKSRN